MHIDNARIWTADPTRPWAKSMSVQGGIVAALDDSRTDGAVDRIDAHGAVITPGLIDSHLHLLTGGKSLERLDLSAVRSRGEFEQAIARRHAELPAGQWLLAWGWSQENWPGHEMPSKAWLGPAGMRPTVCLRMDMHVGLVNDAVCAMCDLGADPPGGTIVRDQANEPTGLMVEAALWRLINPTIPEPDAQGRREQLQKAQRHAHQLGLTSVGSMEYSDDVRNVYLPMRDRLTLRCRITLLDRAWPMDCKFGKSFPNDPMLAVIGYKAFIDGTLGSRTARMLADYADDPGNRGLLVELARDGHLIEWARAVAACGLSPSMHAIGDEAARLALDAAESVDPAVRPRIEHAQQLDLSDISRFRKVIASMQPLHKADDGRYVRARMGTERLAGTFAFRRLRDSGAILAFGSDWPVVSADPLLGIRAAATGLTFEGRPFATDQNLTVEECLRAYTVDAAHCLQLDKIGIGTLGVGQAADLVMFDQDPFTADWVSAPPRIRMTIVGGQVVYDASHSPRRA